MRIKGVQQTYNSLFSRGTKLFLVIINYFTYTKVPLLFKRFEALLLEVSKQTIPRKFAPSPIPTRSEGPSGCTLNYKHKRNGPD